MEYCSSNGTAFNMVKTRNAAMVLCYLLLTAVVTIFACQIAPADMAGLLGTGNAYVMVFAMALLGGFSSWTSFSMIALNVAHVSGGMNLLVIGLISGIGLPIGDFTMFLASRKGRELISGKYDRFLRKLPLVRSENGQSAVPIATYVYMGLTPLPNDMLLVYLGMIRFPRKKIYLPILLADMTYPIMATTPTLHGLSMLG
jgi:hypothetical protein